MCLVSHPSCVGLVKNNKWLGEKKIICCETGDCGELPPVMSITEPNAGGSIVAVPSDSMEAIINKAVAPVLQQLVLLMSEIFTAAGDGSCRVLNSHLVSEPLDDVCLSPVGSVHVMDGTLPKERIVLEKMAVLDRQSVEVVSGDRVVDAAESQVAERLINGWKKVNRRKNKRNTAELGDMVDVSLDRPNVQVDKRHVLTRTGDRNGRLQVDGAGSSRVRAHRKMTYGTGEVHGVLSSFVPMAYFHVSRLQQIKAAEANAAKDAEKDMHPDLFHMKQTVSNACGTIALIHLVANNIEELELKDGPFKKLLKKAQHLSSEERANILQDPIFQDDVMSLLNTHQELAMEGQTDARTESSHHFVALVQNNGKLYELDGRKPCPISHGPTSSEKFVEDAAAVCRKFISNKPNDVKFSVMALTVADNL